MALAMTEARTQIAKHKSFADNHLEFRFRRE
jgi:hypothetical protein